ncbi:hypothetical protein BU52_29910 [Streptomyces toyocaensis]|uniref:Uncharacterized protein n=1 Tax=Streptomyces toyocaensis TaxID=55952 RepID=A0A081XJ53_STRTO|nr:hypothetical protein [Streptomyces toyocaensis]KES03576.1 hypothetical protein BU52_29910 [Streptomyces toyocaensis]
MGQRYHVDPQRIEALTRQLEEIASLAGNMTEEFLDDQARTIRWPGTEGEFAAKARPQEQKERETTKATLMAIRDALVGITDATLRQVEMMKTTRDLHIEELEQRNSRIGASGLGGDGGLGRHGRR